MKRKRIMVITDSIGMPRPGIRYEETWLYLLKNEFPDYDFIDRPVRGSTSTRLLAAAGGDDLLESYMPDIVILQQGMAECAPRLFDKNSLEFRIMSRYLPERIKMRYIRRVKKRRARNPDITEVSPERFRTNITDFFARAQNVRARVIVIPILPASHFMLVKSPRIGVNIDRYNNLYRETVRAFPNVEVVDPLPDGFDINRIAIDETHVNAEGLRMIYEALRTRI